MTNSIKISQLPAATTPLTGAEEVALVQGGVTKQATVTDVTTVIATGSTTARSLANRAADVVNVKDFGAVGDGVTDDTAAIQAAANSVAAGGLVFVPNGTYKLSTNVDVGLCSFENSDDAAFAAPGYALPPALTYSASEAFGKRFSNSSIDAYSIYSVIYPSVSHYDVAQSVAYLPANSTIGGMAAISGYIRSDTAKAGIGGNGVALFGCGVATVNDGGVWGLNTLLMDSNSRSVGAGTGRVLIGAELDFNIMNPGTQVIGASVGGNSLSQSTNAVGYIVNSLGNGNKWTTGFYSADGGASIGMALGPTSASGTSIASQDFWMQYFDAGGVKRTVQMEAVGGFLVINQLSGSFSGVKVSAGSVLVDTGYGFIVNGQTVVSDRKTGWTAPTGTATRTTFDTSTVTTEQLAQRVKALIDDLTAHGLIGT